MHELVWSALQLMILGMGMTFVSLGALTLGMYVLTSVFRSKGAELSELDDELPIGEEVSAYHEGDLIGDSDAEAELRRRLAAAAVAVALAVAETGCDPARPSAATAPQDSWDLFVRSLHLSRRTHYDARRFRG